MTKETHIVQQLHGAWSSGKPSVFADILAENIDGLNVNARDKNGRSLLWLAAAVGSKGSVADLLKHGARINDTCPATGYTPLHAATFWNHPDVVRLLLAHRTPINATNIYGETALMLAVSQGSEEVADILIENKADLNIRDQHGATALIRAASRRRTELVKRLLSCGAEINLQDNDGMTALMHAANGEIASLLIESRADVRLRDKAGKTVYDYMENRPEILRHLNRHS